MKYFLCFMFMMVVLVVVLGMIVGVYVQVVKFLVVGMVDKIKVSYVVGWDLVSLLLLLVCNEVDLVIVVCVVQLVLLGQKLMMSEVEYKQVKQVFIINLQVKVKVEYEQVVVKNKVEGDVFIVKNKLVLGVKIMVLGLQYQVILVGSGLCLGLNDMVQIIYIGIFVNGEKFDVLVDYLELKIGILVLILFVGVILGFCEGLMFMQIGVYYKLFILLSFVYGVQLGNGFLLNEMLIFDVILEKIGLMLVGQVQLGQGG